MKKQLAAFRIHGWHLALRRCIDVGDICPRGDDDLMRCRSMVQEGGHELRAPCGVDDIDGKQHGQDGTGEKNLPLHRVADRRQLGGLPLTF